MSPDISQLRFDFVHFSMVGWRTLQCNFGSVQFYGIFQIIFRVNRIDGRVTVMAIYSHCSVGRVGSSSFADKIMDNTVSLPIAINIVVSRNDI